MSSCPGSRSARSGRGDQVVVAGSGCVSRAACDSSGGVVFACWCWGSHRGQGSTSGVGSRESGGGRCLLCPRWRPEVDNYTLRGFGVGIAPTARSSAIPMAATSRPFTKIPSNGSGPVITANRRQPARRSRRSGEHRAPGRRGLPERRS